MPKINDILNKLDGYETKLKELSELILANIVMIGEIPAPTFGEKERVRFLIERFSENRMLNCSTDEKGNALGIIPGIRGDRNIMIVAHTDSYFDNKIDHTIGVQPQYMSGPGIGDNALGVAALASLPAIIEHLGIELQSNIIIMGSSRSLGRGDIEGLRFFLENSKLPISAGLCLEGVRLGRLSYSSIGMIRCELTCEVPEQYDWTRFGAVGSIITINEVINRILEIPMPKRPRCNIAFGSIEGGKSFNALASKAVLRFEIRSESGEMVSNVFKQISNIASEVSSHTGEEINLNVLARRQPGGIDFSHPLASAARQIMSHMKVKPRISPSTSELAAFIAKDIPALTIGLTTGDNMNQLDESIEVAPIYTGLAQLIALIETIDRGYSNET
ncbi:MAG: M20/M25/M40 family metallo-hydrolase [Spirochaetales bacterium]|uniref:M20/M25/M40 family metallo-hydrolase n=1 Tax=Candidatus Thalassospirochaeta sargassi TaxID=3119039 RepID=A0AAJ1I9X3_9SPIO|nr:M20/M25/M40 family metallo-hydrolase [Spirochaetales bacterium]